jgi:hypothetical protein
VAAQTGVSTTVQTYASRITNKFVYDFYSDGQIDSWQGTTSSFYNNGGYNTNKYRYILGGSPVSPSSTIPGGFVKVQSA